MVTNSKSNLHHRWRIASRLTRWLAIFILFFILLRLVLPSIVKAYVNHQLNKSAEYAGRIGDVDIHLWRGAYQINNVEIFKKGGGVQTPFFAASVVDLSIQWKELFHGSIVGKVAMNKPRLNFVSGPSADETQTGKNTSWDKMLESLFPFKLNRFDIKDGQVHFQNEHSTPPVDIFIDHLFATATNLTNARNLKDELPAGITAQGTALGGGKMDIQLQLNPLAVAPTFEVTAQLTNVDLVSLNDFLKAYGKFDVERGEFALYTSIASKNGTYEGYFKVFFENLDVFAWEKERKKNALEVFWQGIVGTVATVFKNQPTDRLATKVPISGSYSNSSVGVLPAVTTLLRNAFIQALVPKLDQKLTVKEVAKDNPPPVKPVEDLMQSSK